MACRFGFIVATLAALLVAPPEKAQADREVSGVWLAMPKCVSANAVGQFAES